VNAVGAVAPRPAVPRSGEFFAPLPLVALALMVVNDVWLKPAFHSALTGKLSPMLFRLFMQQMRLRLVRRLPLAFGWLTKRGDAATARWMRPILRQRAICQDTVRVLRAVAADTHLLLNATERLSAFDRPTLVVWASEDRVMPLDHGHRLAKLLPRGQLVEIGDSYTLIPLDQPAALARAIREFIHRSA